MTALTSIQPLEWWPRNVAAALRRWIWRHPERVRVAAHGQPGEQPVLGADVRCIVINIHDILCLGGSTPPPWPLTTSSRRRRSACTTPWPPRGWSPCITTSGTTHSSSSAPSRSREPWAGTGDWWPRSWRNKLVDTNPIIYMMHWTLFFLLWI